MNLSKKEIEERTAPFVARALSQVRGLLYRKHIEPFIEDSARALREGLASENETTRILAAYAVFSLLREPEKVEEKQ